MQWFSERFKIFVPLVAGVYLGFYVFGLVMGVFGFNDLPVLHLIALVCVVGLAVFFVALRAGVSPFAPDSQLARRARNARETRGF